MDETIETALSELALEGESGCSLTRFWYLIELRMLNSDTKGIQFPFDNYMKEFIFESLKSLKDVSIRQPELSGVAFADESFQSKTILIASSNLRNQELKLDCANITWTDQLKRIFQRIISAREDGVNQASLAKEENIDPRSCFHYIKTLIQAKLCVKIPILTPLVQNGCNVSTNLVIHQKFKNTSPAYISFMKKNQQLELINLNESLIPVEASKVDIDLQTKNMATRLDRSIIIEKMKLLLEKGKDNTLRLKDMMSALIDMTSKSRKSLGIIVALLKKSGYLKTFDIPDPLSKLNAKRKGLITCIQMIKPLPTSADEKFVADEFFDDRESTFILKTNVPIEAQVYNLILESGPSGISSFHLMNYLSPYLSYKSVNKVLNCLQGNTTKSKSGKKSPAYIKSVHSFDGKVRCARYFATEIGVQKKAPEIGVQKKASSSKKKEIDEVIDPPVSKGLNCLNCKKLLDLNLTDDPEPFKTEGFCSKRCQSAFLLKNNMVPLSNHGLAGVSINGLRRSKYIENILDRLRIVEFGGRFNNLIVAEAETNGEIFGYNLDSKTVHRDVARLIKEKRAQVKEGRTAVLGKKRRYITHKHVDDQEFQEFLKEEQSNGYSGKLNREIQEIEVDALVLLKGEAEQSIHEAPPDNFEFDLDDDVNMEDQVSLPAPPPPQELVEVSTADDPLWLEIASSFGYIEQKYKKAKLVHLWLFDYSETAKNNIIASSEVFEAFPLTLYLKVVGVRKSDDRLTALLQDPDLLGTYSLSTMPEELKYLTSKYNLKRILAGFMDVLESFALIECLNLKCEIYTSLASVENNLAPYYRVLRKVPVYIDLFDATYSKTLETLCGHKDILKFWESMYAEVKSIKIGKKKLVSSRFKGIATMRNWVRVGLTVNQRRGMLAHADPVNGFTPMRNSNFCQSLSRRFSIPLAGIQEFYAQFEARHKKLKAKSAALKSNTLQKNISVADSKISAPDIVPTVSEMSSNENAPRTPKKAIKDYTPKASEKAFQDSADDQKKTIGRRKANQWSTSEDDLFCYGYVVMIKNQKGKGISSSLARKLLPDRMDLHPDAPRRRIRVLKEMKENTRKLELIGSKWEQFHALAMKEKSWYANGIKENLEAIFLVVCEEFRNFVESETRESLESQEPVVPASDVDDELEWSLHPTILGRDYTVSDISIPIDEGLEARTSRASKLAFLNTMSFSIPFNSSLADCKYASVERSDIRSELAFGVSKLIMMMAEDSFNAQDANNVMVENFTQREIDAAVERIRSSAIVGLGSKAQKSQTFSDRRPPNRAQISERALTLLNGILSKDFFTDAKDCWKHISNPAFETEDIPEHRSSGMMATLTDVLFFSNFTLEAADLVNVEKEGNIRNVELKFKKVVSTTEREGQKRKDTEDSDEPFPSAKIRKRFEKMAAKDPISDFKSIISLLSQQNNIQDSFMMEVYDSISSGGVAGKNIKEINEDMTGVWTRSNLEVMVSLLLLGKVIVLVGFDHPRYVTAQYEVDWMVYVNRNREEGRFIKPELWGDLDGTVNTPLFQKCLECVFGYILQKPGITENNIFRRVSMLFNFMELRALLDNLVSKGIVYKLTTPAPAKISGLLSGLFRNNDENDGEVLEEVITSYFISPNWVQLGLF